MGVDLTLHGRKIESIFELLGRKENDITFSIGWALAQCETFRHALLATAFPEDNPCHVERVALQQRAEDSGITDIELIGEDVHVIIEAKRGWDLPSERQFSLYTQRFHCEGRRLQRLVSMSEASVDYADIHLPRVVDGVSVIHLSWRDIDRLARIQTGKHAEKRLLRQLRRYLSRFVRMQNQESNLVYVVSLSLEKPEWSQLAWNEMIDRGIYFHPVGGKGRWPKEPPNYLGFRFDGRLQSIHHIEDWKIVTDMAAEIPELNPEPWPPHFLYTLGPAIVPTKKVRTGKLYRSGRVWAMLDLLLTCDTIAEATDKTRVRRSEE